MGKNKMPKFDKNILSSFVLNEIVLLVITAVLLFGFKISFRNGDEYGIAYSMAGGFGFSPANLVYATIGPVFGALEAVLSVIIRNGSVYMCTLVLLALLSANNFYLALRYLEAEWYGYIVNWAVLAYMLLTLNYSLITIVLSGSALLLAYAMGASFKDTLEFRRGEVAMIIVSLVFAGSLRYPLCFFVLLCVVAFAFPYSRNKSYKPLIFSSICLVAVVAVNYVLRLIICGFSKVSGDYLAWYDKSVGFRDFPDVDFTKYQQLFDAVGWSSNDVDLLNHWGFDDLTVFTTEKMSYVLSNIPLKEHYNLSIRYTVKELLGVGIIWTAAALLMAAINCAVHIHSEKKVDWISIIRSFLILLPFVIIMVGLSVRQRVYAHIYMPFMLLIVIELIIFISRQNRFRLAFGLAVLVLVLDWNLEAFKEMYNAVDRSTVYGEYVAEHRDETFLIDNSAIGYMTESATPLIKKSRYQLFPNLVTMSDYDTASPRDFVKLQQAGIADTDRPYSSLLDENVYYIGRENGTQLEYLTKYFKEHYDIDVTVETVHDFGMESEVRVYKFR